MKRRAFNLGLAALPLAGCARRVAEPGDKPALVEVPPDPFGDDLRALKGGPELIQAALARGRALDARLRAVIEWNPRAVEQASGAGPLAGIPVLVKDNLDTVDMDTTAGSLALLDRRPARDSVVVERLRAAGAVILGKANMSEWANFRSTRSQSGWSARGGQCVNPWGDARCPCGSSSGSAVAVAAGYAPLSIGTETDGSIHCPASQCGLVGVKPTVGLVPGAGIIPIASQQDTAGPMARSVRDAAVLLSVIADGDADYAAALDAGALRGAKLGIAKDISGKPFHPEAERLFRAAVDALKRAGAVVEERDCAWSRSLGGPEFEVLLHAFKDEIARYLEGRGGELRSLEDLLAFHRAEPREMTHFGLEIFEMALAKEGVESAAFREARARCEEISRGGLTAALDGLDALIAPTTGPAWVLDPVFGDHFTGGSSTSPAAVAGWPSLTVPMGRARVPGGGALPVGLSFIGRANEEAKLLSLAFGYEQATRHFRAAPV